MAKIGEGDQRWIVNDRADGTNCGNWHWEEKDLSTATHEALKEKFKNLELTPDGAAVAVTVKEMSDISGDVTVAQRKGKIMCYFDLKFTLKYKVKSGSETGEGKVSAPEVDHDNFHDDFTLSVSATDAKEPSKLGEKWMCGDGRKAIRKIICEYFDALFVQHNVGKMLTKLGPAAGSVATNVAPVASSTGASPATPATPATSAYTAAPAAAAAAKPAAKPKAAAPPPSKSTLSWKLEWRCPVEELWLVLTDAGRASHYTRAPAKIDPRSSGTFEYLGGLITGYFVDVIPQEKLAMQWRLSSWPSGVFSSVILNLSREEAGVTRLEFAQAGIPDGDYDRVRDGWLRNFWDPIKAVFGFNYESL